MVEADDPSSDKWPRKEAAISIEPTFIRKKLHARSLSSLDASPCKGL